MNAELEIYTMDPERERDLAQRIERASASHATVVLEIAGSRYRLVPVDDDAVRTTDNPAAEYDPAKALAAVEAGFGAFQAMDVETFLAEILEAREQDTPQHSF